MWQAVAAAAAAAAMRKLQSRGAVHGWMQSAAQEMDPEAMANPMYEADLDPNVGVGAGQSGVVGTFLKSLAANYLGGKMMEGMQAGGGAPTARPMDAGTWRQLESGMSAQAVNTQATFFNVGSSVGFNPATLQKVWNMGGDQLVTGGWGAFVQNYLDNLGKKKTTGGLQ